MPVDLKALFPKLTNLLLDAVFVVDLDDRIVFVTDACEALLGYRADELVGTPITDCCSVIASSRPCAQPIVTRAAWRCCF